MLAVVIALTMWVAPASADVLVIGDSLGVGTDGPLRAALPDVTIESDVVGGRPSPEGVSVLRDRLRPAHDTVVFDLGTNDGPASVGVTAASLAAARDLAGDRCLVIATLNRPPLAGISIDTANAMIRRFAAEAPNAVLVDWNDAASSSPGALGSDGVHATSAGYALRGALFANAIVSCLAGGSGGGGAPPVGNRSASSTSRPAARRAKAPPKPSPGERLLATVAARLTSPGGPIDRGRRVVATIAAAGSAMRDALTPRGPEPVLGAP